MPSLECAPMWLSQIQLENVRSIESATLTLSPRINLLVGRNNSGKSTVLLPILGLQDGLPNLQQHDKRLRATTSSVQLKIQDPSAKLADLKILQWKLNSNGAYDLIGTTENSVVGVAKFPGHEP